MPFACRALILTLVLISTLLLKETNAVQSTITEAAGQSCMGEDKSRKQTRLDAFVNAKKSAVEHVISYIKSETRVRNFVLESDMVEAYIEAKVKVLNSNEGSWYKDEYSGECFKVSIKAEVIPDENALKNISGSDTGDNPDMPLNVKLWTGKKEYRKAERVKIFLKGNKPFYAEVIYKDAKGSLLQLLPNPYRKDNYFNGGVVYELPAGTDKYELEVSPPFGKENIIVYASTAQLGELELENLGAVYGVKTNANDIGVKTRGVKIVRKTGGRKPAASEFFEDEVIIQTIE